MPDFEQLGAFYLGRAHDLAQRRRLDQFVLLDSRDLVTHAVCVGMTGSGKTGLCIGLLEEAAIDGVPSIIIDPKGDLANLLLTFPQLRPEDFRPWVNEDDAAKKGLTPDQFAAAEAQRWAAGLADWGQDAARIQRLRDAAEFRVFTPGSSAGLPISVLKSFDVPPAELLDDPELIRDRISGTVTSLLGLLAIDADPMRSREHLLLASIFADAWSARRPLDLPALIHAIQHPPFSRLGVMELESIYPAKDRFALALALNNLVASPGFAAWTEGEPLDVASLLHSPAGKPRVSIFSIAHLPDAERMFFVSLLLNHILAWTRAQPGTSSLRALVYMDEIAGYFPPTANPPSKRPLLTLMKQARAFGVGIVLATQNPVDLDYKGLANAGAWFIGRLQTQRDKDRVLDGLEGAAAAASASFNRAAADAALSALGSRVFLLNNVHEDAPVIFETRWTLSYLRGPLTRNQLKLLRAAPASDPAPSPALEPDAGPAAPIAPAAKAPTPSPRPAPAPSVGGSPVSTRPILPPEIPQFFIPSRLPAGEAILYRPTILACARIRYVDAKSAIEFEHPVSLLAEISAGPLIVDWDAAAPSPLTDQDLQHAPATSDAAFAPLPIAAIKARSFDEWTKSFVAALIRSQRFELLRCPALKQSARPGESERDFRLRLAQAAREERDALTDELRAKFASRLGALQERLRRAEQAAEVQREQASAASTSSALSFGAAIVSAFLGPKLVTSANVSRAASAAKAAKRTAKEKADIARAEETLRALRAQRAELESEFQAEFTARAAKIHAGVEDLETLTLRPKKSAIAVRAVVLAWAPSAR